MALTKTEKQAYTLIRSGKGFEIRFYPAVTMATVISSAESYKELGRTGFRQLAGYIFGHNETGKKIAMTAPVHMDIKEKSSSMSFVMPGSYNKYNLPKPLDPAIIIQESPEEYVAVLSFGGFASDKDIQVNAAKLENILIQNGISYYGNFRFLGYNPPYQLFGRKNEIIVAINWRVDQ